MVSQCPICGRSPKEYVLMTEKGPAYCYECLDSFSVRDKASRNEAERKWNEKVKSITRRIES